MVSPARIRFVMTGTIDTVQTWSTSVWMSGFGGTPSQSDLNDYNDDMQTAAGTHIGTLATALWTPNISATDAFSYYYDAGATVASLVSTPSNIGISGGTSSIQIPPQCSVVMSLRSDVPGRSGRGRNYWPIGKGTAMGADGQLATGVAGTVATAYAAMLGDFNTVAVGAGAPATAGVNSVSRAAFYDIVRVVVDTVVDTQRRRSDQIAATAEASVPV